MLYLTQKYCINTFVLAAAMTILPLSYGLEDVGLSVSYMDVLAQTLPFSLFWGALFAAGYTYWDFHRKNIWVLYDNLRLPRLPLLVGLFLAVQLLNLCIYWVL